ncbi:iron ABC transporter substrate-binding protein [Rhodococcus oxybenzonivorans]|uniref:Iron ABC transporter substrate-binding protein n=1 Tax=Rhodococcus oxybenzonivorans TaxID=1990687 RepID=A0A2S2BXS0_9NOCA|nr:ABC transporter substrate-binding protein [Rhodococcus oxybenzonivorans]AWK73446.1 iron ABC transporter substrate-binding protein [Rhodococcus oxybenzonivorans]
MHRPLFRRFGLLTAAVAVLLAAACSRGEPGPGTTSAESFTAAVTITNCSLTQSFDAPPQRIVSMNDHVTEVLIEMGVGDRIVGTGYGDATPLPPFAEEFAKIPHRSKEYPTREQLLDLEPDLVVGGMRSAFDEKEGRSREFLAEHGIPTFLFSEYCGQGFPDIALLRDDFTQLGEILAVPDRAHAISDRVTSGLQSVRATLAGSTAVPVFFYDSGENVPLTVGGVGIGQLIADHAGAANIFSEGQKPFSTATWEIVGERSPEVIVVLDYGATSAQHKIDFLTAHPIMSATPAVKAGRFVVVPLDDFFESPRLVRSVETIARAVHPGAFSTR